MRHLYIIYIICAPSIALTVPLAEKIFLLLGIKLDDDLFDNIMTPTFAKCALIVYVVISKIVRLTQSRAR